MKIKKQGKKQGFHIGWKDLVLYGFLLLFLIFLTIGLGDFSYKASSDVKDLSLSQILSDIKTNKVKEVLVSNNKIDVIYRDNSKAVTKKEPGSSF